MSKRKMQLTESESKRGVERFNHHLAMGRNWDEAFRLAVEDILDESKDVVDPRQLPLFD